MKKQTPKRVRDPWNQTKIWLIKTYKSGAVYINQEIAGRTFYKSYQRTTKARLREILGACSQ